MAALRQQVAEAEAALRPDGHDTLQAAREELAAAVAQQDARQRELDASLDAITQARAGADARRGTLERAAAAAQQRAAAAKGQVALGAARVQELARSRERAAVVEGRVQVLEREVAEWTEAHRTRAAEASMALNKALARCEEQRRIMAAEADGHESVRVGLVRALNASVQEVEVAAAQVAACEEAASSAQMRANEYASLQHDPTCRLCLQVSRPRTSLWWCISPTGAAKRGGRNDPGVCMCSLSMGRRTRTTSSRCSRRCYRVRPRWPLRARDIRSHHYHAHPSLRALPSRGQPPRAAGEFTRASVGVSDVGCCAIGQAAQQERRVAHGKLEAADEGAREGERDCQRSLAAAEAEWNAARMKIAGVEMEQSPSVAALAAARDEQGRALRDVAELQAQVSACLHQFFGAAGQEGKMCEVGDGKAGDAVGEFEVALARAEQELVELDVAAAEAARRVKEEGDAEAEACAERDEALAVARSRAQDAAAAVEQSTRLVEQAEGRARQAQELANKLAQVQAAQNPWQHEVEVRRSAVEENSERLAALRAQLADADGGVVLWARVDELLGKRGLQNFVYEVAVLELQRRAAKYLEILSEDSLRLQLSLDAQVVERRLLVRLTDGTYASRSLHQLSGGQWRRLSLALSLAYSECSLERSRTECNLLVLDEVMQHLDSQGCMRVGKLLEDLISRQLTSFSTVLVILQTSVGEELGDAFDEVDVIVKRRDSSLVQSISGKVY